MFVHAPMLLLFRYYLPQFKLIAFCILGVLLGAISFSCRSVQNVTAVLTNTQKPQFFLYTLRDCSSRTPTKEPILTTNVEIECRYPLPSNLSSVATDTLHNRQQRMFTITHISWKAMWGKEVIGTGENPLRVHIAPSHTAQRFLVPVTLNFIGTHLAVNPRLYRVDKTIIALCHPFNTSMLHTGLTMDATITIESVLGTQAVKQTIVFSDL